MPLRIGTAERDSTFLSQGLALKQVLDRVRSLAPVGVQISQRASIENAERLAAGALDFGFMASNWIGRAQRGAAPFKAPIALRMAAPMNAGPLFFIVRADSAIHTVADLAGKRVVFGAAGSGMVQHAQVMLGALGLDVTPVYLDFAAGADALVAGAVDAQLQCPIPNKVMTALSERSAIRVLSYAPGDIAKVLAAGSFYRPTVMRQGAFRGHDHDVEQVAVVNVLVTHEQVAEHLVRETVAAIVANSDKLAQANPLFTGLDALFAPLRTQGAAALEFDSVALHPGAHRAYRDAGLIA
jgi:TRAP transporter TAXI family solute receptor